MSHQKMKGPESRLQTVKQLKRIEGTTASCKSDMLPARMRAYDYL